MEIREKPLTIGLTVYNALILIIALAGVAAMSFFLAARSGPTLPRELSLGFLFISLALLGVSILGLVGTQRKHRSILWIYAAISLGIIVGLIVSSILLLTKRSDIRSLASDLWNSFDGPTRAAAQSWGRCCGFDNYSDRVFQPCKEYLERVGCWVAINELLDKITLVLVILFFGIAALQSLAVALTTRLIKFIPKSFDIARGTVGPQTDVDATTNRYLF